MKNYFKRTYLATVMLATSLVAFLLKVMVAHVIELKGLDLNPPSALPPPPPEPTVDDLWNWSYTPPKKQFSLPYVPKWVAASLKDPAKHPGFSGKVRYQSVQATESLEVSVASTFVDEPFMITSPEVGQIEGHTEVTATLVNTNTESVQIEGHTENNLNIH